MRRQDRIISSALDNDFYTFSVGQFVFHRHRSVPVRYGFRNRTKSVNLAKHINEQQLREELDHVKNKIRFLNSDLHYLRGTNEYGKRMFEEDYLDFLREFRFPDYDLKWHEDGFDLEFAGTWAEAIYWEVPALAIVNQLYFESLMKNFSRFERDTVYAEGKVRLAMKVRILRHHCPELKFSDFGTRRRFSAEWQDEVNRTLIEEFTEKGSAQFLGTSNVLIANKYNLMPMGTSSHQTFMIMAANALEEAKDVKSQDELMEILRQSQLRMVKEWTEEYGLGLSIFLPDTFGSKQFFELMPENILRDWKGSRQDSGDPDEYATMLLEFYEKYGIDSRYKILIPSDGQTLETMIPFFLKFRKQFSVSFGWGTNLTNDLGLNAISIVIKPIEAFNRGLVKLSDNAAKAIGNPADKDFYKRAFRNQQTFNKECKY